MQRQAEIDEAERLLVQAGRVPAYEPKPGESQPVVTLPPLNYKEPADLPASFAERNDLEKMMDRMEAEEKEAQRMGVSEVW